MRVGRGRGGGVPVPERAVLRTGEEMGGMETVELNFPYCRTEQRDSQQTDT